MCRRFTFFRYFKRKQPEFFAKKCCFDSTLQLKNAALNIICHFVGPLIHLLSTYQTGINGIKFSECDTFKRYKAVSIVKIFIFYSKYLINIYNIYVSCFTFLFLFRLRKFPGAIGDGVLEAFRSGEKSQNLESALKFFLVSSLWNTVIFKYNLCAN